LPATDNRFIAGYDVLFDGKKVNWHRSACGGKINGGNCSCNRNEVSVNRANERSHIHRSGNGPRLYQQQSNVEACYQKDGISFCIGKDLIFQCVTICECLMYKTS
jgi:hypothetical protein